LSFRVINGKVVPIDIPQQLKNNVNKVDKGNSFKNILENELNKTNEVKISGHAMERLKSRNIELDAKDMEKLSQAMDKAESKGARESLLLYKDTAFIASIRNKTIITAVDKENTKDNVFTNIDSAVIIP
jgi:flagellar operon protein